MIISMLCSVGRRADEEPFVNARVNRGRGLWRSRRDRRDNSVVWCDERLAALHSRVLKFDVTSVGLTGDQTTPRFVALMDDLRSITAILGLAREGKLVLRLTVRDLVDTEPLVRGTDQTREMLFDVLDVIQLGGNRIIHIDHDHLPVRLAFIKEGHYTKHLNLLDLTSVSNGLADFNNVKRVVVAVGLGVRVGEGGVLPRLGEGSVVPNVTLVGERIANVAQLALLRVLLEGVKRVPLADLDLGVGPARDLNNKVQNAVGLISVQRHVVEWRQRLARRL